MNTACLSTSTQQTPSQKTITHQVKPVFKYEQTQTFTPSIISLWDNGAPGFEDKKDIPEQAKDWWVRDIHNPSLTAFLPKNKKSRAAIIVVPGGGHENLVFNSEGQRPAAFLNQWGVTAFALKYRLARQEGSPYDIQAHAGEDLRRAVKWLRAHADDYDIDPAQIGVMGFSAGGELVNFITYAPLPGEAAALDPIERQPDHPDFTVQIYPGPIGVPKSHKGPLPPAFFLTAFDDKQPAKTVIDHYNLYQDNEASIELHVFSQGGHAFNMGTRSDLKTISDWPNRLKDWLTDQGYLTEK